MNNIYGYIRVSTISQREDRQWAALDEFCIPRENVFVDKQSGKDFDRLAWSDLMARFSENDTLIVKSLDRLGRSYDEMIQQLDIITCEKGAAIVVIDLPLLDKRTAYLIQANEREKTSQSLEIRACEDLQDFGVVA